MIYVRVYIEGNIVKNLEVETDDHAEAEAAALAYTRGLMSATAQVTPFANPDARIGTSH